jgi:hypothetical protein
LDEAVGDLEPARGVELEILDVERRRAREPQRGGRTPAPLCKAAPLELDPLGRLLEPIDTLTFRWPRRPGAAARVRTYSRWIPDITATARRLRDHPDHPGLVPYYQGA